MAKNIESWFAEESDNLKRLHHIVKDSLREEELIVKKILSEKEEPLKYSQKLSDRVARFGGSWAFIIFFCMVLAVWIFYNSVSGTKAFDPFPYILMNLILSCIAALQAPIIMMSQNRQEEKDRKRAENDYMVNLKAEIEIRSLHQKIDLLLEKEISMLFQIQQKQMELLNEICQKMEDGKN